MRPLTIDSIEFQRIMHNLHIEKLEVSEELQKRLLDFINAGHPITPAVLKELYQNG